VVVGSTVGTVLRPSLLGALVGKAASLAIPVDPGRDRHRADFVTLVNLIENPDGMREQLTGKDADRVLAMLGRIPETDPLWRGEGSIAAARGTAVMAFGPDGRADGP